MCSIPMYVWTMDYVLCGHYKYMHDGMCTRARTVMDCCGRVNTRISHDVYPCVDHNGLVWTFEYTHGHVYA